VIVFEAVVAALTPFVLGALGILQARAGRTVKEVQVEVSAVRGQVTNEHGTNLRDDLDKVHASVHALDSKVSALSATQEGMETLIRSQGHQIGELRSDVSALYQTVADHATRYTAKGRARP
jgi:peptidoglycan hydrolase CwlO-like protein